MPAIQSFIWRHFCVDIHDITVHVDVRKGGYILIPNKYRIQGAKPIVQANLNLQGAQGGFLCTPNIVEFPSQGTLLTVGKGWFYVPNTGAHVIPTPPPLVETLPNPSPPPDTITKTTTYPKPDDDSFQFTLSIFGQTSPVATVHIMYS